MRAILLSCFFFFFLISPASAIALDVAFEVCENNILSSFSSNLATCSYSIPIMREPLLFFYVIVSQLLDSNEEFVPETLLMFSRSAYISFCALKSSQMSSLEKMLSLLSTAVFPPKGLCNPYSYSRLILKSSWPRTQS